MEKRDFFLQPPLDQCRSCQRQITFSLNILSGREGPLDYKSTVYVARRRDCDQYGLKVLTIKQFLEMVDCIQLKSGERVDPAELRFLTTHFESCPRASSFSKSGAKAVR